MKISPDKFKALGRAVIETEMSALSNLIDRVDDKFVTACNLLLKCNGRVVVIGMGKSGHIGNKIAATLASTGTPAFFVHPGEASHGDLGMMAQGDVALVLSNSGETPELANLVAYTRRFRIPLIGVASNPASTLLAQSDVALVLPQAPEACGTGIVPITFSARCSARSPCAPICAASSGSSPQSSAIRARRWRHGRS